MKKNTYEQYPMDYSYGIFYRLLLKVDQSYNYNNLIIHRDGKLIYCLCSVITDLGEGKFALGLVFNNIVHKQSIVFYETLINTISQATKTMLFLECNVIENRKKVVYYHQNRTKLNKNINAIKHIEQFLRNRLNNNKFIYVPTPFYGVQIGTENIRSIYGIRKTPFVVEINNVQTMRFVDYVNYQNEIVFPDIPKKHILKQMLGTFVVVVVVYCIVGGIFIGLSEVIKNETHDEIVPFPDLKIDTTTRSVKIEIDTIKIDKYEKFNPIPDSDTVESKIIANTSSLPSIVTSQEGNKEMDVVEEVVENEDSVRKLMRQRMFNK